MQTVPLHPVPKVLMTALGRQSDLSLVLQTKSVEVFSNSLFHGTVSMVVPLGKSPMPVFSSSANTGTLASNATVTAGFAPASAFTLDVNGVAAPRAAQIRHGHRVSKWAPTRRRRRERWCCTDCR